MATRQIHIGAGVAYLRTGDLEGAADRLGPVLALPVDHRLATLTDRLGAVGSMLAAPRFGTERKAHALAENIGSIPGRRSARERGLFLPEAGWRDTGADGRPLVVAAGLACWASYVHLAFHVRRSARGPGPGREVPGKAGSPPWPGPDSGPMASPDYPGRGFH